MKTVGFNFMKKKYFLWWENKILYMIFAYEKQVHYIFDVKIKFCNLCIEITQVKNIHDSATSAQCCFFEEKKTSI